MQSEFAIDSIHSSERLVYFLPFSECVKLKEKEAEARRELKELSKDVSDHSRLRKSEVEEAEKNATKLGTSSPFLLIFPSVLFHS
jgi:hypothetical protein